jgi:hypothetical protein
MDLHLTKPMERRSIAEAIRRVCVVGQDWRRAQSGRPCLGI